MDEDAEEIREAARKEAEHFAALCLAWAFGVDCVLIAFWALGVE